MKGEQIISYGFNCRYFGSILVQMILLEENHIIIMSPYISNFDVEIPKNPYSKEKKFLDFLFEYSQKNKLKLSIYTIESTVNSIKQICEKYFDNCDNIFHIKNNIHKKCVITSELFYQGSANLTFSGTNINLELCQIGIIKENDKYVEKLLLEE